MLVVAGEVTGMTVGFARIGAVMAMTMKSWACVIGAAMVGEMMGQDAGKNAPPSLPHLLIVLVPCALKHQGLVLVLL